MKVESYYNKFLQIQILHIAVFASCANYETVSYGLTMSTTNHSKQVEKKKSVVYNKYREQNFYNSGKFDKLSQEVPKTNEFNEPLEQALQKQEKKEQQKKENAESHDWLIENNSDDQTGYINSSFNQNRDKYFISKDDE